MGNAKRDDNRVPTLLGLSSVDSTTPVSIFADPVTHRLYVDASGSVTGAAIAAHFNTDQYSSTNGQTAFIATLTVIQDRGLFAGGSRLTPTVDYTITGSTATLTASSYPFGLPGGTPVVWDYIY